MSKPMDDKQIRRSLTAFADGELDVPDTLATLEHMAMHPESTRRVMHQQQLRQAVGRCMSAEVGATPTNLRRQLEQLAASHASHASHASPVSAASRPAGPSVLARLSRWLPAAVAAGLLLAAMVTLRETRFPALSVPPADSVGGILPASMVERLTQRHITCSRELSRLHAAARFPREVDQLPAAVATFLHVSAVTPLDLRPAGYELAAAGECKTPGPSAVHVVYRSTGTDGVRDSVSLWVTPASEHQEVAPGKVYSAGGPHWPHPILFWRRGDLVYYLVGDASQSVEHAAQLLAARG